MRTTLNVDDDVLALVRQYAENCSLPLGKAVSVLVRRGFAAHERTRIVDGVRVADLPPDSPIVTTEHLLEIEAESE